MSYGLLYTLPFRDIRNKLFTVKVAQDGYVGEAIELKGQRSPFTVTIDDEAFLYTPIRCSTATLHLFGSDYLQSLFSTDYRMNRVTLYDGDNPVWCGYVKPEVYTQDFRHVKFPLDIECYSAMSVLEFIDFKQQGETRSFVSLWDLIKLCIKESGGLYGAVYIPHVYATNAAAYGNWENPLSGMTVSQQNFFDEDDKAMTLKEVLENIMQLLGWTCVDWQGELYFVDVDNESGEYYKYTPDLTSYERVSAESVQVQDIGFSGADHTLDIVPGYNKVTVRCSNYPVGDALPDTDIADEDYLTDKDERSYQSVTQGYKVVHHRIYRPERDNYKMFVYKMGDEPDSVTELSKDEEKKLIDNSGNWLPVNITGAIPHKYDEYNEDSSGNADITDYDYTEEIVIPIRRTTQVTKPVFTADNRIPIICVNGVTAAYSGGAFVIESQLLMRAEGGTVETFDFHFSLRIGDYYYHGKSNGDSYWDTNSEQNTEYNNNLTFNLEPKVVDGVTTYDGPYEIVSSRTLNDGLDGISGYICRLPYAKVLSGDLEFIIYGPAVTFNVGRLLPTKFALTNFGFTYHDYKTGISESSNTDRLYENVINESYINALDDIELKISSYNNDGACYSKVLMGEAYLTDNLYNGIIASAVRPEEFLIRRIINQYSATKYKLNYDIKNKDVKPVTMLYDSNTPDKAYLNIGGEIDYQQNKFSCIMLEK